MKTKQIIRRLKELVLSGGWNVNLYFAEDIHRAIAKLKRDVPKKVKIQEKSFSCPKCKKRLFVDIYESKFCSHCGQKLKWVSLDAPHNQ